MRSWRTSRPGKVYQPDSGAKPEQVEGWLAATSRSRAIKAARSVVARASVPSQARRPETPVETGIREAVTRLALALPTLEDQRVPELVRHRFIEPRTGANGESGYVTPELSYNPHTLRVRRSGIPGGEQRFLFAMADLPEDERAPGAHITGDRSIWLRQAAPDQVPYLTIRATNPDGTHSALTNDPEIAIPAEEYPLSLERAENILATAVVVLSQSHLVQGMPKR